MTNTSPQRSPDPEYDNLYLFRKSKPYKFDTQGLSLQELLDDELAALRAKRQLRELQEKEVLRRAEMVLVCYNNSEEQAAEMLLCKNDVLYFINNYCYTFDPRAEGEKYVPFLTFEFQNELARWIVEIVNATLTGVETQTGLVEKSRDMGVSWIFMCVSVWFWLFHGGAIHIGSRVFDEADMLGDPGSMLEKVRIILRRLPQWMLPGGFDVNDDKKHMKLGNIGMTGMGTITAEAASSNFGRSDRKTLVIIDELPSWEHDDAAMKSVMGGTTNAVFVIGTPNGPFNRFARMANPEPGEPLTVEKKTFHWMLHPIKRAGYRKLENVLYPYTSHWWREATKNLEPEDIASEIEIKYDKSARGIIFSDYNVTHQVKDWQVTQGTELIYRIQDPGVHWFVLWCEVDKYGRFIFFDETYHEDAFVDDVAWDLKRKSLKRCGKGMNYEDCGDPNGAIRQVGSAVMSDYDVLLKDHDIRVDTSLFDGVPADEKVTSRISQIHKFLRTICGKTGTPMILVDIKNCPILHRALSGGYRRKVDPKTKKVLDAIHNTHPDGDSIDCMGMGVIQVVGMPGEYKKKGQRIELETENVFDWSGRADRKLRSV